MTILATDANKSATNEEYKGIPDDVSGAAVGGGTGALVGESLSTGVGASEDSSVGDRVGASVIPITVQMSASNPTVHLKEASSKISAPALHNKSLESSVVVLEKMFVPVVVALAAKTGATKN